jgi:hypothetical protein
MAAKKRASGPTQPEDDRKAKAVLLRLLPVHSRQLDTLAKRWGCSRSEVVSTLIVNVDSRGARSCSTCRREASKRARARRKLACASRN